MQRVFVCLTLVVMATASAADLDTIIASCNDCHGENGVSEWNDVPTIAGLSEYYHADQLYYFQEQERRCIESEFRRGDTSRPPTSMCDVAADLSEDDMEALAAHYAALPFVAAEQEYDAELAAAGRAIHEDACEKCHADGGSSVDDDAGILAGQWTGYLESAMARFRSGERYQLDTMQEKMDALSDDDVRALLHYYASQQ